MNSLTIRSLMVATLLWGGMAKMGLTQIVPDSTLGSEASVLNQTLEPGTTWIEGGATRSTALFHSFLDFNVNDGQRVYFANPAAIETIFSRVTGGNPSQIFGTLGVGGSADLFLINPQGILFGPGARLDISGSFTASTAETLTFGNGLTFSTVNPADPPLLQVNVQPGLQGGVQEIRSLGNLKAGKNLTLQAGTLEIAGTVQSGENLLLQGQTVNLSDGSDGALKVMAGGDLTLEGADQLSISALRHPHSLLYGGNNLTLRSNQPVIGDGHFYSGGGGFRVETLAGDLNRLESPEDPVIRTTGDVTLSGYIGSSLHILAGGSVNINGDLYAVVLTGADPLGALPQETITLSDGTPVTIDGATRPTLDIRAGITDPTLLAPLSELLPPDVLGTVSTSGDTPTRGDININGPVYVGDYLTFNNTGGRADNAQIVITNRWGCNAECLPGDITLSKIIPDRDILGGTQQKVGQLAELWIDSSGNLNLGAGTSDSIIDLSSEGGNGGNFTALANGTVNLNGKIVLDASPSGNGGNVSMISGEDLTINAGYSITSQGRQGGEISLRSTGGNVIINGDGSNTTLSNASTVQNSLTAQGGDINLNADAGSIFLQNGARIESQGITNGTANLGSIQLTASDTIRLSGQDSTLLSTTLPGSTGQSGDITLTASHIEITGDSNRGALLSTATQGSGKAGNIRLDTGNTGTVRITENSDLVSSVDSQNATGEGGDITITTGNLEIINSNINGVTRGLGKAGNISLQITNNGLLDNSQINTLVGINAKADGGNIQIQDAEQFSLINNSFISSEVGSNLPFRGEGNAGNITLSNIRSITLQNTSKLTSSTAGIGNAGTIAITNNDRLTMDGKSQISTAVTPSGEGNAGAIVLNTQDLTIAGGSFIISSTDGLGGAGTITLTGANTTTLDGGKISTAIGKTGTAPASTAPSDIRLETRNLNLRNQSTITSATAGIGSAGSIAVTGDGAILLDNSTLSAAIEPRGVANPNLPPSRITLTAGSVTLQNGAKITSETQGTEDPAQGGRGDAGTIAIETTGSMEFRDSSLLSAVGVNATGNAGGIQLKAGDTVSLLEGSLLTASTLGQGNSGAIEIIANRFLAEGADALGYGSGIFSTVGRTATGNSGGITLNVNDTVSLLNGVQLDATTYGIGNSGAIDITAQDVYVSGEDRAGFLSSILSTVESTAIGNSGGIRLNTGGTVSFSYGARMDASTFGQGDSGTIDITAKEVIVQGQNRTGQYNSNILSKVESTGIGNSGGIRIQAGERITLLDGGVIATTTFGQGNSGAIDLRTQDLLVQGQTDSFKTTNLDNVQSASISNVQSAVADSGRGNSGTITVTAQRSVSLLEGGQLNANTFGQGNSGAIVVTTADFLAQGISASGIYRSGIQSGVGDTGIGNSQGITLTASGTATFRDGALLNASTLGTASERSNITINAPTLTLDQESTITASTAGFRDPGLNNAGKIEITSATTTLAGGSTIKTSTAGSGAGGEIILIASEGLFIRDEGSGIFSDTEENSTGNAGSIFIDPPIVDLRNGAGISVNSLGSGTGGDITLVAGNLTLNNNAFISASTVNSNGGQLFLTIAGNLLLLNNSYLSAAAGLGQAAGGDGGSITIDAAAIFGFNNGDITANAGLGNGGNITINSPILLGFLVENISDTSGDLRNNISATGQASAGTIIINNSVDPSKGLDPLAVNLADLARQVRQSCDISSAQTLNQFRIAGRGGLPSTPQDPLQSQATLEDLRLLEDWTETPVQGETIASGSASEIANVSPTLRPSLSEAISWKWVSPQEIRLSSIQGNTPVNIGIWSVGGNSMNCAEQP